MRQGSIQKNKLNFGVCYPQRTNALCIRQDIEIYGKYCALLRGRVGKVINGDMAREDFCGPNSISL